MCRVRVAKPFVLLFVICLAGLSLAQAQSTYEPYSFTTQPVFGVTVTYPSAAAVDSAGNIYLANTGDQTILKITSSGAAIILAGQSGVHGFSDGTGSAARFFLPRVSRWMAPALSMWRIEITTPSARSPLRES